LGRYGRRSGPPGAGRPPARTGPAMPSAGLSRAHCRRRAHSVWIWPLGAMVYAPGRPGSECLRSRCPARRGRKCDKGANSGHAICAIVGSRSGLWLTNARSCCAGKRPVRIVRPDPPTARAYQGFGDGPCRAYSSAGRSSPQSAWAWDQPESGPSFGALSPRFCRFFVCRKAGVRALSDPAPQFVNAWMIRRAENRSRQGPRRPPC